VILTLCSSLIGWIGSLKLFKATLSGVLGSPISFFDTTPMGIKNCITLSFNDELINFSTGRILSRLSKDQDTIDQDLPMTLMQVRNHAGLYVGKY
jgi:ATP-binding cassette subfamily C (CFTR/MRP) protein 1